MATTPTGGASPAPQGDLLPTLCGVLKSSSAAAFVHDSEPGQLLLPLPLLLSLLPSLPLSLLLLPLSLLLSLLLLLLLLSLLLSLLLLLLLLLLLHARPEPTQMQACLKRPALSMYNRGRMRDPDAGRQAPPCAGRWA